MNRAEERANEYVGSPFKPYESIDTTFGRNCYRHGYEQAEKDFMEKFKMWVAHNGYTAQESELVYNDFKQFITE